MRDSGLPILGEVAWGTHFCQFYQTRGDLLDVLVPYFRAGLANNEFCMWIASEMLHADQAKAALASAVADLDGRTAAGQVEILDYRQWYVVDGRFDGDRVLRGWVDKLEAARRRGFEGLRLSGDTFWLEDRLWKDFSDYEAAVDSVIGRYRMLALCTYPLDKCGAFQVMDVVRNHQFALMRQDGKWEIIQSMRRKTAELALQESEQRYHTLFSTMNEGFALHEILCDGEGRPCDYRFLEVNPAFERQTGLKSADLVGKTVREVLPGIEPIWIERYGRVALTGQPDQFESWSETLGRWYDVRAYQTTPGHFAVVFTDITERKQAETALREAHERVQLQAEELQTANEELHTQAHELQASNEELRAQELALRESEERFRATYEHAAIGIEMLSLEGRLLRGNGTLCRILGYSQQELQQRRFSDITHPEDLPQEMVLLDDLVAGRIPQYMIEKRYLHKDGHSVWVRVTSSLARVAEPYRISIIEDITERKQMEADLRRLNDQLEEEVQAQTEELKDTVDRLQEEAFRRAQAEDALRRRSQMLEAFFQHTITPLAFMDRDFNFLRVNEAYAKADGKPPEYFFGKNHFDLYPHDENRRIFEHVRQTKQPYFAYAKPFTYPNAPHRVTYWNWQLTPLLDEHRAVQFLVLNLEDVTERQKAFQELEHRARQLQKLTLELSQAEDRERRRLAEILHDDLQQQLAAAKFHLSLLGNRVPKEKAIQGAVAQLDQILRDAIEKSRSLSHELSPALLYQSDLGETFEWLARQLKTKHGLTVHIESRGRVDSASEALKVFLYKTAREILFNVVKHARVREARLRIQRLRGSLWLTISDRGQGFDPQTLGKTGGYGLLSIRERIELLGGRMKIRSAAGRGSTFLMVVPDSKEPEDRRQTTDDGQPHVPPSSVLGSPSSALRVLLVDDHKVMREGLAALLNEQADLNVVGQAGNGREAVDLAFQLRPDVVVMDVALPLMAGDEATRQIKLHLPDARVVALSMFEAADMAEAMRQAGAEAYLLKTAPSNQLLAAIRGRAGPEGERE